MVTSESQPAPSGAPVPSEGDLLAWIETLRNWGRWGPEDELGTLNLITPAVRRRGAGLVREGIAVPLAWELDPPTHDGHGMVQRYMMESGAQGDPTSEDARACFPMEYIGFAFHGLMTTHLDAPPHCIWDGQIYNGFPGHTVTTARGALRSGVQVARQGFSGRGVLIDLGEFDRGAFPADVEEAERRQGVHVEPGDMVLLRVGVSARRRAGLPAADRNGGWHAAMLPWLRQRDVALIGSDAAQEARPTGYEVVASPIHIVGLVSMGLWLLDNCDLEGVAETCARLGRWEFQLTVQPLPVRGGTGSPVAPVATF
jgi:kynurenine formamidase